MAPLSLLQDYMEPTTTMKPQHCTTDFTMFATQPMTSPCFSLGAWRDEEKEPQNRLFDGLPFAFPECQNTSWDQDNDDDSQSCDWSVASSDTSISWDHCEEENEEDEALSTELDDYLNLCIQKQQDERPRLVHFCDTTMVETFVKVAPEYHKDLYYTAHELQRMIDDFIAEGGSKLLG